MLCCGGGESRAVQPCIGEHVGTDSHRLEHGLERPLAPNGKSALLAMKIWQGDVNARGGLLGRPVKLLYYDDESNPATVPGIYTKLLDVDKVDLVIGGYGTNMLAPAMPVVMQHGKVFIGLFGLAVKASSTIRNTLR